MFRCVAAVLCTVQCFITRSESDDPYDYDGGPGTTGCRFEFQRMADGVPAIDGDRRQRHHGHGYGDGLQTRTKIKKKNSKITRRELFDHYESERISRNFIAINHLNHNIMYKARLFLLFITGFIRIN